MNGKSRAIKGKGAGTQKKQRADTGQRGEEHSDRGGKIADIKKSGRKKGINDSL